MSLFDQLLISLSNTLYSEHIMFIIYFAAFIGISWYFLRYHQAQARMQLFVSEIEKGLETEICWLVDKFSLKNSIRKQALRSLQISSNYTDRFELIKLIFYYAKFISTTETSLYILVQEKGSMLMEHIDAVMSHDPHKTPTTWKQWIFLLVILIPFVFVIIGALVPGVWYYAVRVVMLLFFLIPVGFVLIFGTVFLQLLLNIVGFAKPSKLRYLYDSYVLYQHILLIDIHRNTILSLPIIHTPESIDVFRKEIQSLQKQILFLKRDWKRYLYATAIPWHKKLFIQSSQIEKEDEFRTEIYRFIVDIINEIESTIKTKLATVYQVLEKENTQISSQSWDFLILQSKRLEIFQESIKQVIT